MLLLGSNLRQASDEICLLGMFHLSNNLCPTFEFLLMMLLPMSQLKPRAAHSADVDIILLDSFIYSKREEGVWRMGGGAASWAFCGLQFLDRTSLKEDDRSIGSSAAASGNDIFKMTTTTTMTFGGIPLLFCLMTFMTPGLEYKTFGDDRHHSKRP